MSLLTSSGSRNRKQQKRETNTQLEQRNRTSSKVCVFCSSNLHWSTDCSTMKDYESRIAVVKNKRLCFNCLGSHQVSKCKSRNRCRNCQQKHHTSICQTTTSQSGENSRSSNTGNVHREENTAILHTCDVKDSSSPAAVLNSTSVQHTSRVLLKTAIAPVSTGNCSMDPNILFDEGSQRSFITSSLAEKLHKTRTETDTIHLASFGSEKNQVRHLETSNISIVTTSGKIIPINVLIVPVIAVPLQNYSRSNTNLPYLKGLRLAHPVTDDLTFEVQLLVGADSYWKIVEDTVIRGEGPTAVKSNIGYLLSGPVRAAADGHGTDFALNVLTSFPQDFDLERFWNLESMGIQSSDIHKEEKSDMTDYQQTSISFFGEKYVAKLPWKPKHQPLPANYETVKRRTQNLIRRLRQEPASLEQYGNIIAEQKRRGFIEEVPDQDQTKNIVHYIPHHAVRKDSLAHTHMTSYLDDVIDINRFSHLLKLVRVTAFVKRFIFNCQAETQSRRTGPLTIQELADAETTWIRHCQQSSYGEEILNLRSKRSRLPLVRQLRLYLDQSGDIRCGGCIHNAPLEDNTKFPLLLPVKHPLTLLVILNAHENQLHSGTNATVCHFRQKFWIPRIRQTVKSLLRKCVTCRKFISNPYLTPDPSPLPKYRVDESSPFTVTGVDFSGALYVRTDSGKEYVCLFTCASTRAVHLELVHNLTVESFLLAFRRFVSRRSVPTLIISDNASTYHAASNILKKMFESTVLRDELSKKGTEWRFIPNRAPWYGGWWERMIGIVKTTLKKTLGRTCVKFESLQTVLTEAEAVLNDRPLTYVTSGDSLEPVPLTPSHLLHGRRLTSLPQNDIQFEIGSNQQNISKRARKLQTLLQSFSVRWKNEYLTALREWHTKTGKNEHTIQVGDVVQVHDEIPRLRWKLAVVEEITPGRDGYIRSAKIRTSDGYTTRPIAKLYPLEITENSDH